MKQTFVFRECVEPGAESIGQHNAKLDNEKYEEAMRAFPVMCADVMPINRERGVVYLAPRTARPKRGYWVIGGRVMRGELVVAAALRKLRQEAGLEVEASRLVLVALNRYICADREQEPREAGADTPAFLFTLDVTDAEVATMNANLDREEYEHGRTLRAFTREEMVEEGVDPALIAAYGDIFD